MFNDYCISICVCACLFVWVCVRAAVRKFACVVDDLCKETCKWTNYNSVRWAGKNFSFHQCHIRQMFSGVFNFPTSLLQYSLTH